MTPVVMVDMGFCDAVDDEGRPIELYTVDFSAPCPRCGKSVSSRLRIDKALVMMNGAKFVSDEMEKFRAEFAKQVEGSTLKLHEGPCA